MQGNPTPVNSATAKGARSKAKNTSKYSSLQGDKVVSEKEMRLAIKSLLLQNFLNAKTKEWGKVVIEVASTLKTELRTVIYIIEDILNEQDGKAKEGMKKLERS